MAYYLLSKEQYEIHQDATTQEVAWSLDGSNCIIEADDLPEDYTTMFANADTCNVFRYDTNTEEWRNWMTEEDYFGQ